MNSPRYWALLVLGVGWVTASLSALTHAQTAAATAPDVGRGGRHRQVVTDYCIGCHNQRAKVGGLALDSPDLAIADHREIWEKVLRKVRTREMPPQGARRPEPATYSSLVTALETELDGAAASTPYPGRPLLRRLNRTEYANAVRDLLALDVDVASLLPPDDSAYGFDNIADVLGLSPVLLERYLTAAERLSALAVGDPDAGLGSRTYRLRQDLSQDQHVDGLPLGTVGGALVHHTFPLDGDYVLKATLFRNHTDGTRGLEHPHQLEITVDGERVFLETVGGEADFRALYADSTPASDAIDRRLTVRVPVKAGPHAIGVDFVLKSLATNSRKLRPYLRSSFNTYDYTGLPHISTLSITGPYNATGPGDTPSRRRIFTCRPSSAPAEERPASAKAPAAAAKAPASLDEAARSQARSRRSSPDIDASEDGCAIEIVTTLARRAYRRPPSQDDVQRLMRFYREERGAGGFEAGIQMVVQRILSSPKFILRAEEDPPGVAPGAAYRVGDVELASRLSFFLWSSIPDDELQTAALRSPDVLDRQVRRLLADARADALVTSFADQWLQLRNLQNVVPNSDAFPDFDDNLRQAFRRETQLLFGSIVREDRSIHELLTADYTFINERLAKHYGIRNVYGSHFRRVPLSSDARRGLLGHGSILTVTSHPTRTSPVVRGKWILDNLLGTPPPPAPPNVPSLKENEAGAPARTMREQLAEHRIEPGLRELSQGDGPARVRPRELRRRGRLART